MENRSELKPLWYLITIDDPNCLPGRTIFDVIQILLKVADFKFVIVDDIEGAYTFPLQEIEDEIVDLSYVMNLLNGVKQFDWGDFFLFKKYPEFWDNPKGTLYNYTPYPIVIEQTDTTVRAVDDQYVYIYTPNEDIVNVIKKNYIIESITLGELKELPYPY